MMGLSDYLRNPSTVFRPTPSTLDLDPDETYRILSSQCRGVLLEILDDRADDEVMQAELARALAADEYDVDPWDMHERHYEAAYVALYQSYLPLLEQMDAVAWDSDSGRVEPTPSVPRLVAIVQEVRRRTYE